MKVFSWVCGLCFLVFSLILGGLAGAAAKDLEPKTLFEKRCSKCHGLDRANQTQTPEMWRSIVKRMKAKLFSGISDEDAEAITEYLIESKSK
jgi:cytochrome c2